MKEPNEGKVKQLLIAFHNSHRTEIGGRRQKITVDQPLAALTRSLPRIIPSVVINKREEFLPVLAATIRQIDD